MPRSSKLKLMIKSIVPLKYRTLRYTVYRRLRYYPDIISNLCQILECPFCRWHFRRFLPTVLQHPVIMEKQVIGFGPRLNAICPRCHSNARERLMYFYLRDRTRLFTDNLSLLHIAPEPQLQNVLANTSTLDYFTADLDAPNVMMKLDLMQLPFYCSQFDVIICSHVLEHIPDDRKGMRELFRVLRPGGWALLQVPIAMALEDTHEDPTILDE